MKVEKIEQSILDKYIKWSLKLSLLKVDDKDLTEFRTDFEKGIAFMKKITDMKVDAKLEPLHNVLEFYSSDHSKFW